LARVLIVGCGCRGRTLGRALVVRGHAVRGTTRSAVTAAGAEWEALGIEAFVGDPDRVATLAPALEHVSVACVLLGSATGSPSSLEALHGSRLEMLLTRMIDSTVRGIVYEAAGTVGDLLLAGGAALVRATCHDSLIPYELMGVDPADIDRWLQTALEAVEGVLSGQATERGAISESPGPNTPA